MDRHTAAAMSGGVDSSTAAWLLLQEGHRLTGLTLTLFDTGREDTAPGDALQAAQAMGFPHRTLDLSQEFLAQVVEPFVRAYEGGRTPNPCVLCNRRIKFGALMEYALALGCTGLATGHYARLDYDAGSGRWLLKKAVHRAKDQSYVLAMLTQVQLSRALFPLGRYSKEEVRDIARQAGLTCAQRPESQDICFVPDGDYPAFLRRYGGVELREGDFVDPQGRVLGRHRGLPCYTTGQRRGLGVSADRPLYVLRKDAGSNTVVLGDEAALYSDTVWAEDFNWVSLPPQTGPLAVTAKTRYSQTEAAATLYPEENGAVRVVFDQPQRAVTAGQSLVCYQGEAVAGGGVICRASP